MEDLCSSSPLAFHSSSCSLFACDLRSQVTTSARSSKASALFLAGQKRSSWVGSFEVAFGPVTWCPCQQVIWAVEIIPPDLAVTEKKLSFLLCVNEVAQISWVGTFIWKENGESLLLVWVWNAPQTHNLTCSSVMKCTVEHMKKNFASSKAHTYGLIFMLLFLQHPSPSPSLLKGSWGLVFPCWAAVTDELLSKQVAFRCIFLL